MIATVCTLFLISMAAAYQQDYCFADEENPYLFYGTKTAYEFVHERHRNAEIVPNCRPIQFWLLARHGTRYPSKKDISTMQHLLNLRDQILNNHEKRHKGRLCQADLDNLKKWALEVFPSQASDLTNQGYDDLKFMARRFKTMFPNLLNQTYSEDAYKFRFTNSQRTKNSAIAFAEGLFGQSSGIYFPEPLQNDTLLMAYDNCPRWKEEIGENNRTYEEKHLFEMGQQMQTLLQNVSERLGFGYRLTFVQLDQMYEMCRFDKAWNLRNISPWCAAFSNDELKLMEYREDLEKYYYSGYGKDLNIRLGCPTVKDMMDHFSKLEGHHNGEYQPTGIFYFTHSTTILTTLAQLGIGKDFEHLTHNNYNLIKNRKWRTSKLDPFAANLAAVFFSCDSGEVHKVMFFLGEHLINYEGCNVGLCNWSFIKEKFARVADECNLDFCYRDRNGSQQKFAITWLSIVAVLITTFWRQI